MGNKKFTFCFENKIKKWMEKFPFFQWKLWVIIFLLLVVILTHSQAQHKPGVGFCYSLSPFVYSLCCFSCGRSQTCMNEFMFLLSLEKYSLPYLLFSFLGVLLALFEWQLVLALQNIKIKTANLLLSLFLTENIFHVCVYVCDVDVSEYP